MQPIEISDGLRKLEFEKPNGVGVESTHVVVEFIRKAPLPDGQPVRISFGSRDGVLRETVGLPQLIKTNGAELGRRNYLYHLRGASTLSCK